MKRITNLAFAMTAFGIALGLSARAAAPSKYVILQIPASAVHHSWSSMPRLKIKNSTTQNWSGYAAPLYTSAAKDTFTEIEGSWVVPTVTGGKTPAFCATWIGIDGYTNGTVEQTGTEQYWDGTQQQNYVWFEMYPNYAFEITGFPVNAGDVMWAQVEFVGTTNTGMGTPSYIFQITIVNLTQNESFQIPTSYTTMPIPPGLSSIEYIVEAPYFNGVLPLANFGQVPFVACSATGIGAYSKSQGASNTLEPLGFWPADPLTMVDPAGGGAIPSGLSQGGSAFMVTWQTK